MSAALRCLEDLTEKDRPITYGVVKPGPEDPEKGIVFIRGGDIVDGTIVEDSLRTITQEVSAPYARTILQGGELVISLVGNPGAVAVVPEKLAGANLARQVGLIALRSEFHAPYFMYYLMSPSGKAELFQRTQGAVQQVINLGDLRKIKVRVPPHPEQQRIADVLSAYDDLIENNRRRIKLLEDAARLLYREWFVRLRFPGHEHVKVVDGVPEGWALTNIGEVASFVGRGITPQYDDEANGWVINQKCIRDGLLSMGPARRQRKVVPEQKIVRRGDVLINSTGEGTLGRVAQVIEEMSNCTVDSHVTIVRPSEVFGALYLGQALMAKEALLKTMGRGATNQTELARGDIEALPILVPGHSIRAEFENFCESLYPQISTLMEQNDKLRQARDLLLPRLMSGELTV